MHKKIFTIILLVILSTISNAQESVTYTWTAPTTGSAVDHYIVQHSENGEAFVTIDSNVATESFILVADYEISHSIRVSGVDSQNRQGPWSLPSDLFIPSLGAPGAPGKPTIIQL